jgi:hypothetical protein
MDQTKRLYDLFKIINKVPNINKIIIAIENAIEKGASLSQSYYDELHDKHYIPPIYYLMHKKNFSLYIIHILKKHWWNPDAMFAMQYLYKENENDENTLDVKNIMCNANVFFNVLYSHEKMILNSTAIFKDLYDLFNADIIKDDKLRHQYILSYEIICDYNVDE